MIDINGKKIKIGDRVSTLQPSGGLFTPAGKTIGIVENYETSWNTIELCIKYRKNNQNFDRFILLNGKINEILD